MRLALVLLLAVPAPSRGAERPAWLEEGGLLYRKGLLSQAAGHFEEAAEAGGGAEAWLNAAVVRRDLAQDEESLADFEKAAALLPKDADVQAELGWAALRAGEAGKAEAAFRAALKLAPDQRRAQLGRARLHLGAGEALQAAELLKRVTEAVPFASVGWLYLARALERLGRDDDAAQAYRRAFEADTTFSEIRLYLGALYQRLERFDDAWRQYALVLNVDPDHREAASRKAELSERLTKKPEELLPSVPLREPRPLVPAAGSEKMPVLRVGVGTDAAGRPLYRKALGFHCTGPFKVVDPESGRAIWPGPAGKRFLVREADGRFEAADEAGRRLAGFQRSLAFVPDDPSRDSCVLNDVRTGAGFSWSEVRDRQLKGTLELRVHEGLLYAVNELPLEDYLYGVVTDEMPSSFPVEALRAQAVIARTHTLYQARALRPHRAYGYDLCDGQHCQVFGGVTSESKEAREAVDATRGKVLRHRGRFAQTPYMSNCGGHTQDSGEIEGWAELPYLKGRPDGEPGGPLPDTPWGLDRWLKTQPKVFCRLEPGQPVSRFRWTRVVSADELEHRANRWGRVGRLHRILVVSRARSGNANKIWVEGSEGRLAVEREHRIRRLLGLGTIRSTLFQIELERDGKGRPEEFVFHGGGWGHGAGLCQFGAAGRAKAGQPHRAILEHYYPGTDLESLGY